MTREQFEEMLLKIADSNQMMSVALANITEINCQILDICTAKPDDDEPAPTLQ